MRSGHECLNLSLLVLLVLALPVSCAVHNRLRATPAPDANRLARVDAQLDALRPILRGYPPNVTSAEQRQDVTRQWEETEADLKSLLESDPDNPQLQWRIGELYRFGHDLDVPGAGAQCVSHLERAIAMKPDYVDAHLELGIFYTKAGLKWAPLGEANLKKAIALSAPTPLPRAWRVLTFAYYYQGRFAESAGAADQYLTMSPDDDDLRKMKKLAEQAAASGKSGFGRVGRVIVP